MRRDITRLAGVFAVSLLAASPAVAACPCNTVESGPICVDQYEASIWETKDPKLIQKIKQGQACLLADLKGASQNVTTYVEGNQRRWVGISRSANWANRWFFRSDLDSFGLEAQRLFDHEHLRLVHVEMLE